MTHLRRRVLRPSSPAEAIDPRQQTQLQKHRRELEHDRASCGRWILNRAFHQVEKQQARIRRFERQIAKLERE